MRKVFSAFVALLVLVCFISCGSPVAGKTYGLADGIGDDYCYFIFEKDTVVCMSDIIEPGSIYPAVPYECYGDSIQFSVPGFKSFSLDYDKKTDSLWGYYHGDSRGTFKRVKNPSQK